MAQVPLRQGPKRHFTRRARYVTLPRDALACPLNIGEEFYRARPRKYRRLSPSHFRVTLSVTRDSWRRACRVTRDRGLIKALSVTQTRLSRVL